jgi:hypothetical protein
MHRRVIAKKSCRAIFESPAFAAILMRPGLKAPQAPPVGSAATSRQTSPETAVRIRRTWAALPARSPGTHAANMCRDSLVFHPFRHDPLPPLRKSVVERRLY